MKSWERAKEWVESVSISSFKKVEDLKSLSIRQLKCLASKINSELGQVIVKAKFGKVMSDMTKAELVDAIWSVRVVQMQTRTYDTTLHETSPRIFEFNMVYGAPGSEHWISYFGFNADENGNAKQNAERFRTAILSKNLCHLAAIRKSERLSSFGFEYEVKVWGLKNKIFENLVAKDKARQVDIPVSKDFVPPTLKEVREKLARQG